MRSEVIPGVGVQPPCIGSTSQTSTANGVYLTSTGRFFDGVFHAMRDHYQVSGEGLKAGRARAERYGTDRVYTLTYQGKGKAGNTKICEAKVTVPKEGARDHTHSHSRILGVAGRAGV
jgi:hypothetical protein